MRIDRLKLTNFKCFKEEEFHFDEKLTLFIGDNGAGKTSILSAAAVALGIWAHNNTIRRVIKPGPNTWRWIYDDEVRLIPQLSGDRGHFEPAELCEVEASWLPNDCNAPLIWTRRIRDGKRSADDGGVGRAIDRIVTDAKEHRAPAPLFAYYGAGRGWVASNERKPKADAKIKKPSQWHAYYDCLRERIRLKDIDRWFRDEAAARGPNGEWRLGYHTVKQAILRCIPDAKEIIWDPQRMEICVSINGKARPFSFLSDGQKTMAAMVADMAIRAVTLNSFLFGNSEEIPKKGTLSVVLEQTPGVVLIDEIDVHLHPKWQRQVLSDLRTTFPKVQFICTSHSPQVLGEVPRTQVRVLSKAGINLPRVAKGADSNWILDHVMEGASSENKKARSLEEAAAEAMEEGDLNTARAKLVKFRELLDGETGTLVRLESSLATLESLDDDESNSLHGA